MPRKLALLLMALFAASAQAKSLYWRALDVNAKLDDYGILHIIERHTMVFDGDWNGGERRFTQEPAFKRLSRIENDRAIPMREGNLAVVGNYNWTDNYHVMRWRIRQPTDPPLQNQTFVYELEYDLVPVLQIDGEIRRLNHDFAFPDRPGEIEKFTLHLDFHPSWKGVEPIDIVREHIPPGEGVIVNQTMTFAWPAAVQPAAQQSPTPAAAEAFALPAVPTKILLSLIAAVAIFWITRSRLRSIRAIGRPAAADINEPWLNTNVFSLKPELLAYGYRGKSTADAVAATLARMSHEEKVTTKVVGRDLDMFLNVPIETLTGYEAELMQQMFRGKASTSTSEIRRAYQSVGFNPAGLIQPRLKEEFAALNLWPKDDLGAAARHMIFPIALLGLAAIAVMAAAQTHGEGWAVPIMFVAGFVVALMTVAAVASPSGDIDYDFRLITKILILVALLMTSIIVVTDSLLHAAAAAFFAFAAYLAASVGAKQSTRNVQKVTWHNRWSAARDFFLRQLGSPRPHLRDEWYPWMLALGLGKNVDAWFRIAAPAPATQRDDRFARDLSASSAVRSTPAPSVSQWTGGGGAFGGAGASGTWAAAASLAAGVSAPASSSSGGSWSGSSSSSSSSSSGSSSGGGSSSSGGGSSSSGGGGGGGW